MRQKYNLNIADDSKWLISTPDELVKRLPFYIVEYGHFICKRNFYTERSGKNSLLLIYTISGKGYLKYMKKDYILKPNSLVLINCEKYHYFNTMSDEPWVEKWIHFSGRAAKEFYSIINSGSLSLFEISDAVYFNGMMDETVRFFEHSNIPTNVKASEHITRILTYLIEQKFDKPKNKMISQKKIEIEKTIEYMKENYKNKISIDELAKNVMVSKYYFIKLFKSVYGTGPYNYLLNIRINIAKNLLITTDMPIKDIAFESGFSNCNNFIKAFKKITGMSPLEYKKSV